MRGMAEPDTKPRKAAKKPGTGKRKPGVARGRPGRPTRYRQEYDEQARKICLLGATDAELASVFGVSEQTLNAWKKAHPSFLESITRGKVVADAEVADRLYQRALGYTHNAVKIMIIANQVVREEYVEHYPPDTPAASLWLRNRQPAKWRDKVEQVHSGPDGGPIQARIAVEFVKPPAKPGEDGEPS